jgi:very-short-patch-repair endonuclease
VQCANERWFRLDLAWPRIKVALEYDGVEFHTGRALTNDRARHNALAAQGWTVLSVTAPMLWSGRDALVQQIGFELRHRGAVGG